MNQEYMSASMLDGDDIYFRATPENFATVIMQTIFQSTTIRTTDHMPFLSTIKGYVECADKQYLRDQISPYLIPMFLGEAVIPELETVSKGIATASPPPVPDWNYMKWQGVSDEQLQEIICGSGLSALTLDGTRYPVQIKVSSGMNQNLMVRAFPDGAGKFVQSFALTADMPGVRKKDCAYLMPNLNGTIQSWIILNRLASPTGAMLKTGDAMLYEYQFNSDKLALLDPEGYADHRRDYDAMWSQKPQPVAQKSTKKQRKKRVRRER